MVVFILKNKFIVIEKIYSVYKNKAKLIFMNIRFFLKKKRRLALAI